MSARAVPPRRASRANLSLAMWIRCNKSVLSSFAWPSASCMALSALGAFPLSTMASSRLNNDGVVAQRERPRKRERVVLGDLPKRTSRRTTQRAPRSPVENDPMQLCESERDEAFAASNVSERLSDSLAFLYCHEVHKTHMENEGAYYRRRAPEELDAMQSEVTSAMRTILIEWLVEVAEEYSLTAQTLFLTVNYVDRFVAKRPVSRGHLQLLGVTAMLIASKFEEIYAPLVDDFVYITDNTYSREQILKTETDVLEALEFRLAASTVQNFLDRLLAVVDVTISSEPVIVHHAHYLAELSLPAPAMVRYLPSEIAAACVILSLHTFQRDPYPHDLEHYTSRSRADLLATVNDVYQCWAIASHTNKTLFTLEKYKNLKYRSVSLIAPPTSHPFNM